MKSLLLVACIFLNSLTHAQSSSTFMGARAQGIANSSACISDAWSVFNNIGGLAKVEALTAAFTYDALPSFKPFNRMAAVVAMPVKFGVAGFGVFRFGDHLYNEQLISVGFSNSYGIASLGVKANYIQYNVEGFGTKGVISFSFGGIAKLTSQLSIGAHIVNINQPEISSYKDERLPTKLIAGVAFTPSDKVFLTTEIEKDLDYDATWKAGIEYIVHTKVIFRTGFNIHPNAGFIGLGFRPTKFAFDYAYQFQPDLGSRHQATVGYKFKFKIKTNEIL